MSNEARRVSNQVEDCLQIVTAELVRVFQGVQEIDQKELEEVQSAIQARASYLAQKIPAKARDRMYLLGLPQQDQDQIIESEKDLMEWINEASGLWGDQQNSGIDALIRIMDFVSKLTIAKDKTVVADDEAPDPAETLFDLSEYEGQNVRRRQLFKQWLCGDNRTTLVAQFNKLSKRLDFDSYRENVLERNLPWGISAILRYIEDVAKDEGIVLPSGIQFLPALVKYGVPSPLACRFVRLGLSRYGGTKIATLFDEKNENDLFGLGFTRTDFGWSREGAILALQSLDSEAVAQLQLEDDDLRRLEYIQRHTNAS